MAMPVSMLLAQSGVTDPAQRKKLMDLVSADAGAAAAATAPTGSPGPNFASILQTNPAFQPAEEQSFSLAGNAPIGGGAPGIGSALLGNAPPQAGAQPQRPARKKFQDTAGYAEYQAYLKKYNETPWWMPAQRKDRLSKDMGRALEVSKLELSADEGEDVSNQRWANLLEDKGKTTQAQTNFESKLRQDAAESEAATKRFQDSLDLDRKRFSESVRQHNEDNSDRDADRAYRERVFNANQAAAATRQVPSSQYDLGAADPASTGVFARFAESLRKGDPLATGEDVAAAQVDASRGGGLPPMMSTPADRPRVAVDPKTKKRFYVYANGRVSPAP